jgi:hypothetical protein
MSSRDFFDLIESEKISSPLFCRIFLTRTGVHLRHENALIRLISALWFGKCFRPFIYRRSAGTDGSTLGNH